MKISRTILAAAGLALVAALPLTVSAAEQHDNLLATLWTQQSVEFKGNARGAYALATLRLDQALADKNWTAVAEQGANYQGKPPAVILDVDETVLDNSLYQAWIVKANSYFSSKTWGPFVNSVQSRPIPGSLEFTKYAASKGVAVFYVSNRTGDLEPATRKNLEKFGYPMGSGEDTVLLKKEKPEWKSSKKSPRRAHVAAKYRVLLVLGDNFGDFVDGYKGSMSERKALAKSHAAKWGKEWIVLANPTYGSFASAPFGHNWKLKGDVRRGKTLEALEDWKP